MLHNLLGLVAAIGGWILLAAFVSGVLYAGFKRMQN